MNPVQIAQLVALLEQLIPISVAAFKQLSDAGHTTRTVEDLLAQADANYDAISKTAQAEIDKLKGQ